MRFTALVVALGVVSLGSAGAQVPAATTGTVSTAVASASLIDTEGRAVGEARFRQTPRGVLVQLDLRNATPGVHALHIHETGRCDAPSFESAGDHFEPAGREHGFLNRNGQHAGDLPNIDVPASRRLSVEFSVMDVTIDPGPRSLLDADGSAIVVHSGKDDHSTHPSGNSGDRIHCGRIAGNTSR
jgi:Cu-Zn family superoxide dismutase